MAYQAKEKPDIYQQVTNTIIEAMEKGELPFQKAWDGKIGAALVQKPINGATKRPYTRENLIYLSYVMQTKGDGKDPRFYTFNQAKNLGYSIRKGAKSYLIKQGFFATKDQFGQPLPEDECHWTSTLSRVFHASDVVQYVQVKDKDGQPVTEPVLDDNGQPKLGKDGEAIVKRVFEEKPIPAYVPEKVKGYTHEETMVLAENMLNRSGAVIKHDQADRAYYTRGKDEIHLPPRAAFKELAAYYATALHELGHWTGHQSRLNRNMGNSFGSPEYAKEELRAEMASVYLSMDLGLPLNTMNHAAYTQNWLHALKNDKMEFFRAANDAQKIATYLKDLVQERTQVKFQEIVTEHPAPVSTETHDLQITVFQAPDGYKSVGKAWNELDGPIRFDEYKPVYKEMRHEETASIEAVLEQTYMKLNADNRCGKKEMRSLSMGDIVGVDDQLYYVNNVGFSRLAISVVKDRRYLKTVDNKEIQHIKDLQKELVGEAAFKAYQEKFQQIYHEGATAKLSECLGNPVRRYAKFIYDNALQKGLSSIRPGDQKAWQEADKAFILNSFEDSMGNNAGLITAARIVQAHSPYAVVAENKDYGFTLGAELMKTSEYRKIRDENQPVVAREAYR